MKLTGTLKKQVEQATSKEEALNLIEHAGMKLTVDELDVVTGGVDYASGYDSCPGTNTNNHRIDNVLDTLNADDYKDERRY